MDDHRYILEPYNGMKSRYHCPACNSREKTFSRYIDMETGQYIADHVGRCNRESKCGYHYTPKQYLIDNPHLSVHGVNTLKTITNNDLRVKCSRSRDIKSVNTTVSTSFIDTDIFSRSMGNYDQNIFTQYLTGLFDHDTVKKLITRYKIGTSKHWPGSTVFWQIDTAGKIRVGKIMLYDTGGHRVKEPFNHITWVHKILKIEPYNLKQCLFGEHLLPGNTLPIAIVESEKTACIASVYLPQFLWLACGQLQGLNAEKCKPLTGKAVILFPDLKGFEKWQVKAKQLESQLPRARFIVSDYLEKNAPETDKQAGYDIADYLVGFDLSDFAPAGPAVPQWYVDMQGVLRRYQSGKITGNAFLDLQDENMQQSGLTPQEYTAQVKQFENNNPEAIMRRTTTYG